jgi:hypothetical protein
MSRFKIAFDIVFVKSQRDVMLVENEIIPFLKPQWGEM